MKHLTRVTIFALFLVNISLAIAQQKPLPLKQESARTAPVLTRVEHFYLFADETQVKKLFQSFRDDFRLPQVWAYRNWGSYSSGGLSLGNVVLEFATYPVPDNKAPKTEFQGIVFEPVADAETTAMMLKSRGVPHGEPEGEKYRTADGVERVDWTIVPFTDLPPDNVNIMLCDYRDRKMVAEGRSKAAKALADAGGGPLGIISLKEIVVGVKDIKEAVRKWQLAIGGAVQGHPEVFTFESGPQIRLVKADMPGIQRILVRIRSNGSAKQFLEKRQMLGSSYKGGLTIAPSAIGGLSIVLVEY